MRKTAARMKKFWKKKKEDALRAKITHSALTI